MVALPTELRDNKNGLCSICKPLKSNRRESPLFPPSDAGLPAALTRTVLNKYGNYSTEGGTRTPDPLITNQLLYQLSYPGKKFSKPYSDVSRIIISVHT